MIHCVLSRKWQFKFKESSEEHKYMLLTELLPNTSVFEHIYIHTYIMLSLDEHTLSIYLALFLLLPHLKDAKLFWCHMSTLRDEIMWHCLEFAHYCSMSVVCIQFTNIL